MMTDWIQKMFKHSFEKEWYETYWAFDIHGTILIPTFRKDSYDSDFYPYAKETLQLLTKREDIVMIISTSSYPEEIEHYQKVFKENDIHFKYVNENPDIDSSKGNFGYYENKFYFNVMLEDKAGFVPEKEWRQILLLLSHYQIANYLPDSKWSTKF
jgi:hypothetical protein